MSEFVWENNVIMINDERFYMENEILEVGKLNNILIIVTVPQKDVFDNVYGIHVKKKTMWRVQSVKELLPTFIQTPYVGINIIDGEVIITDFCGCRFLIDSERGIIKKQLESVK